MARNYTVEKARKAQGNCRKCGKAIKGGDKYHWAKPRYGGKIVHCDACGGITASEKTGSAFLQSLFALQESMGQMFGDVDGVESDIESIKEELEDMKSTCEESLENMPYNLRETSSSGEMLQERIDNLDSAISDLDSVETEFDDSNVGQPDTEGMTEDEKAKAQEAYEEALEEAREEFLENARSAADDALGNLG